MIDVWLPEYCVGNEEAISSRIQFSLSPLHELLRSLHVLHNPRHHGIHLPWVVEMSRQMSVSTRRELEYFSLCYELGVPPSLLPGLQHQVFSFEEEIDLLSEVEPETLLHDLTRVAEDRENDFVPKLAKGIEWKNFSFMERSCFLADLERDPEGVLERFLAFVVDYWERVFSPLWEEQLQDQLLADIASHSELLRKREFSQFVHATSDRMQWHEDSATLSFRKPFDRDYQMRDDDSLIFVPSYFVWPHLLVDPAHGGVIVVYDSSKARQESSPAHPVDRLVTVCRALGEPTRVKLLTLLQEKPLTTQGLAQVCHLSEGAVSRHLQVLRRAGLLTSHHRGKYVLYRCHGNLLGSLSEFVSQATSEESDISAAQENYKNSASQGREKAKKFSH